MTKKGHILDPAHHNNTARSVVDRKDGRTLRRTTVYFPRDVSTALRMRAAMVDQPVSDIVVEAVRHYLKLDASTLP